MMTQGQVIVMEHSPYSVRCKQCGRLMVPRVHHGYSNCPFCLSHHWDQERSGFEWKFFGLMLRNNGYVLEQLLSPLVVHSTLAHEELKQIAAGCITRHHAHHYLGFAASQWRLFRKEDPPRVKPLLYVYRVLLTGMHLMRTGQVEANLRVLNETARLPFIDELIERKLAGPEKSVLAEADLAFHEGQYQRLVSELEQAAITSRLPEKPTAKEALHALLVRLRLNGVR